MGKKIKKSIPKPKFVRSSSIEKTIDEGKDYIARVDRKLRIRNSSNIVSIPKKIKITKDKNKTKPKSKVRKNVFPHISTSVGVPVIGSSSVPSVFQPVRSASRNLIKTNSKNNQII